MSAADTTPEEMYGNTLLFDVKTHAAKPKLTRAIAEKNVVSNSCSLVSPSIQKKMTL